MKRQKKEKRKGESPEELADRLYTRNFSEERLKVRRFVRHPHFSAFIYGMIFVNTVLIACDDIGADRDNTHWVVAVSVYSDWIILTIFTGEMVLKMIGLGLGYKPPIEEDVDPELAGYFAGAWNRLDSFIVLMSWILVPVAAISGADIEKLVRVLRLTRPLRAIREIKNLRAINELIQTVPLAVASFVDVTGLLLFVLVVFSILALNIWGLEGKFHGRCVVEASPASLALDTRGLLQVPRTLCGAGGYTCGEGFVCSCAPSVMSDGTIERQPYAYSNPISGNPGCLIQGTARPWVEGLQSDDPMCPEAGYTCFNTFPLAMFTSFKAATLESWSVVMWYAMDIGSPTVGWIFFVLLISIVTFNIFNLYVASMSNAYLSIQSNNKDQDKIDQIEKKMRANKKQARRERKRRRAMGLLDEAAAGGEDSGSSSDDSDDGHGRRGKKRSWGEILFNPDTYWLEHEPHVRPLNSIALALRRIMAYPQVVDECGTLVPYAVSDMAKARNLKVTYGPRYGQFSVHAMGEGATRKSVDVHGVPCHEEYLPGQVLVPVEPASYATVPDRQELKELLMQFKSNDDKDLYGVTSKIDKPEPVPYLDMLILVFILINAASSTMEHFLGTPVDVLVDVPQGTDCCDAECLVRNPERCPRGLTRMVTEWYDFIFAIELIFNLIFTIEMVLRILSWWSFSKYISYNYPSNLMDFVIVVTSDTMFLLEFFTSGLFNASILRLVRLVRAVRAFKTASSMKRLKVILDKAGAAFKVCIYVFVILALWHLAMALLGMQLFRCATEDPVTCKRANENATCPTFCPDLLGDPPACKYSEDMIFDHCPWDQKRNFNTLFNALTLLFYVTTGDSSWTDTMHRGMRHESELAGAVFFVFFYMVSVYGICNLFICVILSAFEMEESEKERLQVAEYRSHLLKKIMERVRTERAEAERKMKRRQKRAARLGDSDKKREALALKEEEEAEGQMQNDDLVESIHVEEDSDADEKEEEVEEVDVLFCLPPPAPNDAHPDEDRNFRYVIRKIVRSSLYNRLMLATIFFSTCMLAAQSRLKAKSLVTDKVVLYSDYVCYGIFMMEFAFKVLDTGLTASPQSYFRQGWNWIDFILLLAQTLDFVGVDGMKALRVLRVLRPLRSLRILNKIEKLQLMILAISQSFYDVINVLFLWFFIFLVFGIIGMTLFQGKFHRCSDAGFVGPPLNDEPYGSKVGWRENCVGSYISWTSDMDGLLDTERYYTAMTSPTGILRPRVWSLPAHAPSESSFSFDNFGSTCQALYEISTLRAWSTYVYAAMDATGTGQHPIPNNQPAVALYFIVWVVVTAFFIVQMIIGVLIDSINMQTGTAVFTAPQRSWDRMLLKMKMATTLKPIPIPSHKFIKNFWLLANSPAFQNFYTGVIIFNIGLMATEHYNQPGTYEEVALVLNIILLGLYIIEIIIKVISTLPNVRLYLSDYGNVFDLAVVLASLVDIILASGGGKSGLQALRVLRIVRVFRTLRFVRRSPRLMVMVQTMVASVPGIIAVMGFLTLHIFIFAILGNQFFSGLKFGTGLNRRNNFDSPWDSMLTLFVVVTGDGWVKVLRDVAVEEPMCTSQAQVDSMREEHLRRYGQVFFADPLMDVTDCGSAWGACLYLDLFYFLGFQFLRSLFIAGMMENFFAFKARGNFVLGDGHIESFRRKWREVDPQAQGYIKLFQFRVLCQKLADDHNPLGTSALANEFKFGIVRTELIRQAETRYKRDLAKMREEHNLILSGISNKKKRDALAAELNQRFNFVRHSEDLLFNNVLVVLGRHAVTLNCFPYKQMKRRQAQLSWFGKLAAGARMVAIFRGMKDRKRKQAAAMGQQGSGAMAAMGEDQQYDKVPDEAKKLGQGTASRKKKPPPSSATVSETVLTTLASKDLERTIVDMKRLQERFNYRQQSSSSSDTGSTTGSSGGPVWRNPNLDAANQRVTVGAGGVSFKGDVLQENGQNGHGH